MNIIRKKLAIIGGVLILAALACSIPEFGDDPEVLEAYIALQTCVSDRDPITESDPYEECVGFMNDEQLELASTHQTCLKPDGDLSPQCKAVQAEIAARLEGVLCEGLTPEECANAGQHFYDEELTSAEPAECDTFEWPSNTAIQHISFENDRAILERWSSVEGYDGHVRVGPNTYEWVDPVMVRTIIFSADGYQQIDYQELNNCTWTYTFTLSE